MNPLTPWHIMKKQANAGWAKKLPALWREGFRRKWSRGGKEEPTGEAQEELWEDNPYLPWIRPILCEILPQRGLTYQALRLAMLDVDEDPESIFWEDGAMQALNDLAEDLNGLTIFTERPAYFQEYVERMYEVNGLLVQVQEKSMVAEKSASNVLLDFERRGELRSVWLQEPSLYLPVYKKPWKTTENLDICVPIGYNTVIVRGYGSQRGGLS